MALTIEDDEAGRASRIFHVLKHRLQEVVLERFVADHVPAIGLEQPHGDLERDRASLELLQVLFGRCGRPAVKCHVRVLEHPAEAEHAAFQRYREKGPRLLFLGSPWHWNPSV